MARLLALCALLSRLHVGAVIWFRSSTGRAEAPLANLDRGVLTRHISTTLPDQSSYLLLPSAVTLRIDIARQFIVLLHLYSGSYVAAYTRPFIFTDCASAQILQ